MRDSDFASIIEKRLTEICNRAKKRNLWLYGAGRGGDIALDILLNNGYDIGGFIDRNSTAIVKKNGYPVVQLEELNPKDDFIVFSLLNFDDELFVHCLSRGFGLDDIAIIATNRTMKENIDVKERKYHSSTIGKYTYGAEELLSDYCFPVNIGSYCSIARSARIVPQHNIEYISTHPMLYFPNCMPFGDSNYVEIPMDDRKWIQKIYDEPVVIGNDVWIGANVIIMPHVKIGNGAVIGAGAVVTKDVEDYEVVGGVPAKHIKWRFPLELREKLLEIKWWDWDLEKIYQNIDCFYEPELFLERF